METLGYCMKSQSAFESMLFANTLSIFLGDAARCVFTDYVESLLLQYSVLQIRRGDGDNLGIIFLIFPLKHIL